MLVAENAAVVHGEPVEIVALVDALFFYQIPHGLSIVTSRESISCVCSLSKLPSFSVRFSPLIPKDQAKSVPVWPLIAKGPTW